MNYNHIFKEYKLNQTLFAKKLGITKGMFSRILNHQEKSKYDKDLRKHIHKYASDLFNELF